MNNERNKLLGLLLAILLAGISENTVGQSAGRASNGVGDTLDAFRTPTSPAFVLFGIEPTSVERPTTPRAVAVSLLSSGLANGVIPNNYAIEFSPYWLTSHPDLTYDKYVNATADEQLIQSLSISFATSKSQSAPDSGTDMGAGLRFQVSPPGKSSKLPKLEQDLENVSNAMLDHLGDKKALDSLESKRKDLTLQMQNEQKNRGVVLEFAAALAGHFPQNDLNNGRITHTGLWLTLSYKPEGTMLEFLGVGRLLWNNGVGGDGNYLDAGARVLYENDPILVSGEFVERTVYNTTIAQQSSNTTIGVITFSSTYRASLLIDYKIDNNTSLEYSFGHNFTQVTGINNLISQLGIKFGFGG
jgi:hypothetical protein